MANVGDSKNIIVGAAAFYISDAQKALPTLAAGTSATEALEAADSGFRNVGYTENGVTVSYEPTYGDVTVDQLLDSAVIFKSGMKVTVNTTFAEATLENLVVVWGQADGPAPDADGDNVLNIEAGALGDFPHERALAFVGQGPRKSVAGVIKPQERLYNVGRAIQTQTTAHDLKRDAATSLPVSFRCLPGDDGNYGTVRDRALGAG